MSADEFDPEIERLFGRQLAEHNFLTLWTDPDRRLVAAALQAAATDRGPALGLPHTPRSPHRCSSAP